MGFVMLNPEVMADIKVAIPFVPVATLLFAAALRRLPKAPSSREEP
ncbi:MAG: hypothetical protein KAI47_11375 [Deltaproteobacteria bacterium]|nr:hypothetical protein [Deltaproteobacteria bacterium]